MKNKLFIGGLNYKTKEKSLKEELSKYGSVLSLRIVVDVESGKSRGFAFATLDSEQAAKKVIEELDNTIFDDRRIGVKESIDRK